MRGAAARAAAALAVALFSCACAEPRAWRNQVTVGAGVRMFFDSDGIPGGGGEHANARIGWSATRLDLGLGVETSLSHSRVERTGFEPTQLTELAVGPRYTFGLPDTVVRPYLAAGYAALYARAQHPTCAVEDDFDHGVYFRAGVDWALDERWDVGIDVKVLVEEFSDFGGFDLDGMDATIHLGLKF